jgi:hypothetical protein
MLKNPSQSWRIHDLPVGRLLNVAQADTETFRSVIREFFCSTLPQLSIREELSLQRDSNPESSKPMRLTQKLLLVPTLFVTIAGAPMAQAASQILNISTRVDCQIRDAVVVTEFIVYGRGTETFVLRGIGPSLGAVGVPDPLPDPILDLLDARGNRVDRNDNLMDNPDAQDIENSGLAPGDPLESAVMDDLKPGLYTSVVQGKAHGEGRTRRSNFSTPTVSYFSSTTTGKTLRNWKSRQQAWLRPTIPNQPPSLSSAPAPTPPS